jgi:hypothetical protein
LNVAQLIISLVATMAIGTPLLLLAYLAGRRSMSPGRSPRFDDLRPELHLDGTTWSVEYAGDEDPDQPQVIQISLTQTGCRVVGSGRSTEGHHTLEGIIHLGRLCCVSIDEGRQGTWLGTVTAELISGGQQMTGMRTRWSVTSQTLTVRKATFTLISNAS